MTELPQTTVTYSADQAEAHDRISEALRAAGVDLENGTTTPPREGKEANRAYEEAFVNGLTAFRGAEVKSVAVDEANNKAFVEWHFDFTHADYGDQKYDQVAVQTWEDGQIVDEKFYKLVV